MIIYKNSSRGFRDAVDNNRIVIDIENQFSSKFGKKVGKGEKIAWNNSMQFMETILRNARIPDDCERVAKQTC